MSNAIPLRDRLIPWYFVLFFVVIALVDGGMATLAIRTHTGLVTEHPYEKGLAYNEVVAAESRQEELGWKGEITYTAPLLHFTPSDRDGKILSIDHATAHIMRPAKEGMDFQVPLVRTDTGTWQAKLQFPASGLWEIRIFAAQGENPFQQAKRIVVP